MKGLIGPLFLSFLTLLSTMSAGTRPPGGAYAHGDDPAASAVSRDSLESMVRFLTREHPAGNLRSRFVMREAQLGEVADSLAVRLERYLACPVQRQLFTIRDSLSEYSNDSTFTAENIIGRLAGTGGGAGVVLVTAHYDAIASRSREERWSENWDLLPAPGADDNATGVAALMELARVMVDRPLPFDLLFVLFSGEELGRLGSEDFVERFADEFGTEEILGVFNFDMIGYSASGVPAATVISDHRSGWLADLINQAAASIDPQLPLDVIKPGPSNWDHASFWLRRMSAVTLAEPLEHNGFVIYPYYHTLADTMGWINFEQVGRITALAAGCLAGYSGSEAELQLLPSDLLVASGSSMFERELFDPGDTVTVNVSVRNTGGTMPPSPDGYFALRVFMENRQGNREIYSGEGVPPPPFHASSIEIPIVVDDRYAGENTVRAFFTVSGFDDDPSNNAAQKRFAVKGGGDVLITHGFQPNPIRTAFAGAAFCFNLSCEADMILEIFTIEGERIDKSFIGTGYGLPVQPGLNCITCSSLFPSVDVLASGVYAYRITLFDGGGASHHVTGRFAVEN